MRFNLNTKVMKNMVSKLLSRIIGNKFGYDTDIRFDELDIEVKDGETIIKTSVEIKMDTDEVMDFIKMYVKD